MRDDSPSHDDDVDPLPAPIVPLPRRLPAGAIDRLLADARCLLRGAEGAWEAGPCPAFVRYGVHGDERAPVAWDPGKDAPDEEARAVLVRLERSVRLVLPVHGGRRAEGVLLIDGHALATEGGGIGEETVVVDRSGRGDGPWSPTPSGFFALGLGRDEGHFVIEPLRVETTRDGAVRVCPTSFPESLRRRIAAYLVRLG